MADDNVPAPTDSEMSSAKKDLGGRMKANFEGNRGESAMDKMEQSQTYNKTGAGQGPPAGGLQEFLFQFLKANPDLAREMSTRMNAVINGQRLQGMKTQDRMPQNQYPQPFNPADPTGPTPVGPQSAVPPQQPMQMAGDVIPLPGDKSMGSGPTPAATPFAIGSQTAPNVQSIGTPTLQQWLANVRARQG